MTTAFTPSSPLAWEEVMLYGAILSALVGFTGASLLFTNQRGSRAANVGLGLVVSSALMAGTFGLVDAVATLRNH